ncbi:ski oncogene-like [Nelusetta ayraudi]|uniref:ski oncogene-like n=1 Tax=Nelusetta ayraudi TaxID=303726 RepID=UPI003F717C97
MAVVINRLSILSCSQSPSPVPGKRSKFDKLQSSPAEKDQKPEWLQSLSKSAHKDLKQVQLKQRPSAFRPWSPKAPEKEKSATQNEVERSYSKSQQPTVAPNLTLASPGHPRDSHAPARGPTAITRPLQELHNGDTKHSPRAAPPGTASRANDVDVDIDMDTDGEIDVDDCDDRPVPAPSLASPPTPQHIARQPDGPAWLSGNVCPEIDSLRQLLYAGMETKEAREKVLQDIIRMRVKQDEKLAAAQQGKRSLQQELEFVRVAKKGRLREAIEAKRNLRKDIERLRVDWERKMREAEESCGRLNRELERERQQRVCDKGCEAERLRVKYSTQIEELHVQLQQAEADREQLRQELQQEREARQSLESVVKDLQSQLALQADSSPPRDPPREHSNGS